MASKTYLSHKDARYQMLLDISKKISPDRPYLQLQKEVNDTWKNELESGSNPILFNKKMEQLKKRLATKKSAIMVFFSKVAPKKANTENEEKSSEEKTNEEIPSEDADVFEEEPVESERQLRFKDHRKETKVQDELKNKISVLEKKVSILIEERSVNLLEGRASKLTQDIKQTRSELESLKNQLKRKVNIQKSVQKCRERRKEWEERLKTENPDLAKSLKLRDAPGRPTIEENNPGNCLFQNSFSQLIEIRHWQLGNKCFSAGILETILRIATEGAACGDRRREDIYRFIELSRKNHSHQIHDHNHHDYCISAVKTFSFRQVRTLDELHSALHALGYTVSRSGLYLRMLPRSQTSIEGKKHLHSLPVKLVRPQNDLRKKHPDRMFAAETSRAVDAIAKFFGPEACLYISQDDKSSVPIGRTAAKVQSPMLMSMRRGERVRLPDHDFAVGPRHLLVPSVMAHCQIDGKVFFIV